MSKQQPQEEPRERQRVGGRYELLHKLASGGMATVHVARARGLAGFGRMVAIKCCHPHLRAEEDFARMFLDEARLVAELRHPNVVPTLDFGEDDVLSLYIVMEYVNGFSVQQLLRMAKNKGARMPAPVALRVVCDALQGLQAAHDHTDPKGKPLHIVHRDVSPQNLLLGVDGVTRLMDFGVARAESRLSHTRDGDLKGKAAYMAPEQHGLVFDTPRPLTHRADLYSMGVVLWELLTAKRLFHRENDAQTLAAAIKGEYLPATELEPSLPAKLDVVIATALAREPDARYANAAAFLDALEGCGLAPASTRDVTKWVLEVASVQLEARKAALQRFDDDAAEDADAVIDRVVTSATNARLRAGQPAPKARPAAKVPEEPAEDAPAQAPTRRWTPYALLALGAVLLGAGLAYSRSPRNVAVASAPPASSAPRQRPPPPPAAPSALAVNTPSAPAPPPALAPPPPAPAASARAVVAAPPAPARRPPPASGPRPPPPRPGTFRPTFL